MKYRTFKIKENYKTPVKMLLDEYITAAQCSLVKSVVLPGNNGTAKTIHLNEQINNFSPETFLNNFGPEFNNDVKDKKLTTAAVCASLVFNNTCQGLLFIEHGDDNGLTALLIMRDEPCTVHLIGNPTKTTEYFSAIAEASTPPDAYQNAIDCFKREAEAICNQLLNKQRQTSEQKAKPSTSNTDEPRHQTDDVTADATKLMAELARRVRSLEAQVSYITKLVGKTNNVEAGSKKDVKSDRIDGINIFDHFRS